MTAFSDAPSGLPIVTPSAPESERSPASGERISAASNVIVRFPSKAPDWPVTVLSSAAVRTEGSPVIRSVRLTEAVTSCAAAAVSSPELTTSAATLSAAPSISSAQITDGISPVNIAAETTAVSSLDTLFFITIHLQYLHYSTFY